LVDWGPERKLREATVVFTGIAVSEGPALLHGFYYAPRLGYLYSGARILGFRPNRIYKGYRDRLLYVFTGDGGGSGGVEVELGREYLVYAYGFPAETSLCNGAWPVRSRREDLNWMGPPDRDSLVQAWNADVQTELAVLDAYGDREDAERKRGRTAAYLVLTILLAPMGIYILRHSRRTVAEPSTAADASRG
jgi:hypothetical protein